MAVTGHAAARLADVKTGEALAVTGGLFSLILLQLAATNSFYLLHKYFWIDELCTFALVSDRNPLHALRALQGSVDMSPPGLHLLLLAHTTIAGAVNEFTLRSFALISMVVALVGIYAIGRSMYGVLVSLVAVLAVWSHPLVLDYAFEVRYYGPWLAAAVWYCFLLGRAGSGSLGRPGMVALAVSAFFLCTIHYIGIVTLVIITAFVWYWQGGPRSYSRAALGAIALGPAATAAAAVFLLPFQRAAMTVTTWIPNPTLGDVVEFGTTVFLPLHLGAIAVLAWASHLTTAEEPADSRRLVTTASQVGLTGLALLVPALVAFSYLVQSVLISRYGLPAVAALAPVAAYASRRMSRAWLLLLIAFLIGSSAFELRQRASRASAADAERQELIQDIRDYAPGQPVVFEAPHQLYIVWHYAPDLRARVFLLDFEKAELGDDVSEFRIWARDVARQFAKFYDGPGLLPWSQVRGDRSIYIVPHGQAYTEEPDPRGRYPQFDMIPVHGPLHRLLRTDAP